VSRNTWNTTPRPRLLEAEAGLKWSVAGAVSELVDNSFGPQRGNARNVTIIYNRTKRQLIVRDDGVGMEHIGQLFQLAEGVGRSIADIGKYGSGGTKAIVWLADKAKVTTLRNGKVMRDEAVWSEWEKMKSWPEVSDVWEPASFRNASTALLEMGHGTEIELFLRRERAINVEVVQRDLERTFAPAFRHGKSLEWLTMSRGRDWKRKLRGDWLTMPDEPRKHIKFAIDVAVDDIVLPVTGEVGLIDGLSYNDSTIAVGFIWRNIFHTRSCYEHDGRRYGGSGVAGWIDLGEGWQDFLTTTKDEIKDDRLREALMAAVFEKIEPLLKQTEEERLSIILDGIALDLTEALGNLNQLEEEIEEGFSDMPARQRFFDDDISSRDRPAVPLRKFEPKVVENDRNNSGPHDPQKKKVPPVTRLSIHKTPDNEIGGALCRLDLLSDNDTTLRVEVNKDHEVIEELLKARPLNRMGLNLMITREIAAALCERPALLERVVTAKLKRKLETADNQTKKKERLLARLLMDSARRPKVAA
jgi:hypothetical protein